MGIAGASMIVGEAADLGGSVTNIVTYMGTALKFVTDNEILMLFLAGGIVAMAFGLFRKAKKSVR